MGRVESASPPDGGVRAWLIVLGSFLCNGLLFGIINVKSMIAERFERNLREQGIYSDTNLSAALVTSLCMGTAFFLSPIAGMLTERAGFRLTTFIGGTLATGGAFLASFISQQFSLFCLTYGIIFGIGTSLTYTPSLAILGQYFKGNLGLVNGIVTTGSPCFTILTSYLIPKLLDHFGLQICIRFTAFMLCWIIACSFLFKPHTEVIKKDHGFFQEFCHLFKLDIWRNRKYVFWLLCFAVSLFGYVVPLAQLAFIIKHHLPGCGDKEVSHALSATAIASAVGRLSSGIIASSQRVNSIFMQQVSFFIIGVLTIAMPFVTDFYSFMGIVILFGLCEGCFISLLGPIAFDICGETSAVHAIAFVLSLGSVPLTLGPIVAGHLVDAKWTYDVILPLVAIAPIVGAIGLTATRLVDSQKDESDEVPPTQKVKEIW